MNSCVTNAAADESFRILTMLVLKGFVAYIGVLIVSLVAEHISESRRIARGEEPCLYI
jgi:hypothetical protein